MPILRLDSSFSLFRNSNNKGICLYWVLYIKVSITCWTFSVLSRWFRQIIIYLYCLRSMTLSACSSRVIRIFEFRGLNIASSDWNCLVIDLFVSWPCWRFFCERFTVNLFTPIFVRFTIVTLTWDDFISYSIVLPLQIYDWVFPAFSIYIRCIIYVTTQFSYTGYGISVLWRFIFWSACSFDYLDILHSFVTNVC